MEYFLHILYFNNQPNQMDDKDDETAYSSADDPNDSDVHNLQKENKKLKGIVNDSDVHNLQKENKKLKGIVSDLTTENAELKKKFAESKFNFRSNRRISRRISRSVSEPSPAQAKHLNVDNQRRSSRKRKNRSWSNTIHPPPKISDEVPPDISDRDYDIKYDSNKLTQKEKQNIIERLDTLNKNMQKLDDERAVEDKKMEEEYKKRKEEDKKTRKHEEGLLKAKVDEYNKKMEQHKQQEGFGKMYRDALKKNEQKRSQGSSRKSKSSTRGGSYRRTRRRR